MHPAFSLIIFSTISGLGFGLMAVVGVAVAAGVLPTNPLFLLLTGVVAVGLAAGGLLASVFHLRRPERAWRAVREWRSSWLSREAWLAALTMTIFVSSVAVAVLTGTTRVWLALPAAVFAVATVISTAMIYAQLKTVPRWHTRLTPVVFVLLSLSSGALAYASLAAWFAGGTLPAALALGLIAFGAAGKYLWWQRAEHATLASAGADIEQATGLLGLGRARLFEAPHTGANYLMKEMVFTVGRRRKAALRKVSVALAFIAPAVLLILCLFGLLSPKVLFAAAVLQLFGLFAERWLFFAEAQHAVAAYYGHR